MKEVGRTLSYRLLSTLQARPTAISPTSARMCLAMPYKTPLHRRRTRRIFAELDFRHNKTVIDDGSTLRADEIPLGVIEVAGIRTRAVRTGERHFCVASQVKR